MNELKQKDLSSPGYAVAPGAASPPGPNKSEGKVPDPAQTPKEGVMTDGTSVHDETKS